MKFRFYITDLNNGDIKGSNNENLIKDLAYSDDYFIVDTNIEIRDFEIVD